MVLGLLRTLADRDLQGGDSVSYLDIAFAWARGDFGSAVNAFWSPLYSWLLAVMLAVLRPGPDWEFTAVSAVGFTVYLLALGCFLFFWRAVAAWRRSANADPTGFSPSAWLLLGYALFLWTTLHLARLTRSPADLLMAAFVYAACGLLARMRSGDRQPRTMALFGLALALGYLAKAPMFQLSPVFLIVALLIAGARRLAPAVVCFLAFSLPWIALISNQKGRLTLGDTAHLNYAWHVNQAPMFYWQGEPAGLGAPLHPPRQLYTHPTVYEFAQPAMGSYPIWYDPSYWNEGLWPRFDLRQQWNPITRTLRRYQLVLRGRLDLVLVALALLFLSAHRSRSEGLSDKPRGYPWFLFAPALAGFAMYSLVYVERRHIAVFVVVLWAAVFASLRFPTSSRTGRVASLLAGLTLVCTLNLLLIDAPNDWRAIRDRPDRVHGYVAQELVRRGARPGEGILVIGSALWNAPSAHLARVQIAAEIPVAEGFAFWSADRATQTAVLERVAAHGIRLVVADCGNCSPPPTCTRFANTSGLAFVEQRSLYVCDVRSITAAPRP
ncbi:MAG: hypothetical protein ACRD24_12805 [Terriglobales bacterium]